MTSRFGKAGDDRGNHVARHSVGGNLRPAFPTIQMGQAMPNFPCVITSCAALALSEGGQCAAHAAGYRVATDFQHLRCGNCRRKINTGEWYRRAIDNGVKHVRPCTIHPDVAREERFKQEATR